MFNIVLFEPEIPANTGNIARTCSVTGTSLHLIEPLGFSIDDKHLKRAGLDYWDELDIHIYSGLEEFFKTANPARLYFATTKAGNYYNEMRFIPGDYIIFGKETKGLPEQLLKIKKDWCIRIPMKDNARSLNLSNSVAVIVYEALRQNSFTEMF